MPFPAGLYGEADWAFTDPEDVNSVSLEQIFFGVQTRMLAELHRSYFNVVEICKIPLRTECWIKDADLQTLAQEAGKIYVTLDYFAACLPLPRRMRKMGKEKAAFFYQYFCQRSLENLQANSESLLKTLAVSSLIPDEWFPQENLEKLIEKEIKRSGMYSHVEIDLDLGLSPGGLHWLSDVTRETVIRVREKLASGQPCAVRLIRCPGRLYGNRPVIVYGCQEEKNGKLRLEIFEPGNPVEGHALQVVIKENRVKVKENLGPDRQLPVPGLLYEEYSPAALPRECIPWWLKWVAVRQVWMMVLVWMRKKGLLSFFS